MKELEKYSNQIYSSYTCIVNNSHVKKKDLAVKSRPGRYYRFPMTV